MFSRLFNFSAIICGAFLKGAVLPFLFFVVVFFASSSSSADCNWSSNDRNHLTTIVSTVGVMANRLDYLQPINSNLSSVYSYLIEDKEVNGSPFGLYTYSLPRQLSRLENLLFLIQRGQTNSPLPSISITNSFTLTPSFTNSFTFNPTITNNFVIYPTFTNLIALSPVFTNNLDLSPFVNPLSNISSNSTSSVDYLSAISDKLDQIILSNTNIVNVPLNLEIVTNLAYTLAFNGKGTVLTEQQLQSYLQDYELWQVFNLSPYYWANSGLLFPEDNWVPSLIHPLRNKMLDIAGGTTATLRQLENFNGKNGARKFIFDSLAPLGTELSAKYTRYIEQSEALEEGLYGTYDIEKQLDWFTNKYSEAFTELTNQFSSFTPPQYQEVSAEYSSTTSLVSRLDPQFSDTGSVSGITENTNIVPLANSVLENASQNQWTPNQADYDFSTFQQSVNGFLQQLNNGVNVGSSELSIHFVGWDNSQERTITLDFALRDEAKAKVQALWHTIFSLCKIAICMWGLVSVIQALLSDGNAKQYQDILQGADVD